MDVLNKKVIYKQNSHKLGSGETFTKDVYFKPENLPKTVFNTTHCCFRAEYDVQIKVKCKSKLFHLNSV